MRGGGEELGVGTHRGRCANQITARSRSGLCHACWTPPPGANPAVYCSWCCYPLRAALVFCARPPAPPKDQGSGFVACAFCDLC